MYLWRNLPEGQVLAVLRWMSARRDRANGRERPVEKSPASPDSDQAPAALR